MKRSVAWLIGWFMVGGLALLTSSTMAQQIEVDDAAFASGTYGRNSDVAVLFKTIGIFNQANQFELVLSDANGQFSVSSPVIGNMAGYYATFLNGQIPANAAAGSQYRILLRSTQPAVQDTTPAFSIAATATTARAAAGVVQPIRVLKPGLAFGFCSSPSLSQQLALVDASTAGATVQARLKDDYTGQFTANYQYAAGAQQNVALDRSYYTYVVRAERNNLISTRAYSLINSRNRIILGVDGEQSGCLPQELEFQVGINAQNGGIEENYPGTEYLVEWGDNTSTMYRYAELVANNGFIRHNYLSTSCNRPGVTYNITISVIQPWQASAGCDRPQVTTKAKISKKPHAYFQLPDTGCQASPILIRNISDPGQQVFGQTCVSRADFYWYVNGVLVQSFFDVTPGQANLTHSFTQPGPNVVRLVVDNHTCEVNDSTDTICIEPRPIALLTANGGQQAVSGCAPFSVVTTNATNAWYCRPTQFATQVRNVVTGALVNANSGVFETDSAGHYRFLLPGRYRIILSASNFCQTSRDTVEVRVGTTPSIQWAQGLGRCDTGWVNFRDTALAPRYSDTSLPTQYQWQVSGGNFQTANGAGLSTAFPRIRFNTAAPFTLAIAMTNACGTASANNIFAVQPKPSVSIGAGASSICFIDSVPTLQASSNTASYDSLVWASGGSGKLTAQGLQAIYTASQADRLAGQIGFAATLFPTEKFCAPASGQFVLAIKPNPGLADTSFALCSGLALPQRFANSASRSHQFTSQVVSGQIGGLTGQGNGYPQDLLVNNSHQQTATVVYRFVATENGCTSAPFADTVQVEPLPLLQVQNLADTLCNGATTQIQLSSSLPGAFRWTSQSMPAGSLLGHTQQPIGQTAPQLSDLLQLSQPGTAAQALYQIRAVSQAGCLSAPVSAAVTLRPGNSAALAGPDLLLCNQSAANLQAQPPQLGQGQWLLLSGQGSLAQPTQPSTVLTGLQAGDTARLLWQVSGHNGCAPNADTVLVVNRPLVSGSQAGGDQLACAFVPNTIDSLPLNSQPAAHAWEVGRWQMVMAPATAQAGPANQYDPQTRFFFNQPGNYRMAWLVGNDAGCPEAVDTINIKVFARPQAGALVLPALACSIDTVDLQTAGVSGQVAQWLSSANGQLFQPFTPLHGQRLLPQTDSQWLRLVVQSEGWQQGCALADTSAAVLLSRAANTVAGQLMGADTVCAGSNQGSLQLQQAVGSVQAWQMSTNGGQNWQSIAGNGASLPYLNLAQTTLYRAEVQNSVCPAAYTPSTAITVHAGVQSVSISGTQNLCAGNAAQTLTAQANAGGFGGLQQYWEMSTDSINYSPVPNSAVWQLNPGTLAATTWFRMQANAAVCGAQGLVASPAVRVAVLPLAQAGFALNASGCAPFSLQPQSAAAHASLSQSWWLGSQLVSQSSFPGHVLQQPGDSVLLRHRVVSTAGCGVDSMALWVRTLPKAVPSIGLPAFNACGPVTISLANNSLRRADFQYQWAFGNGTFSNMAAPGAQTFDPHPLGLDTSYRIELKAMNACDTAMATQLVQVKSKPRATFSPDKTTGCSPLRITFSNTTLGQNQYRWTFGDGSPASTLAGPQLQHTYTTGRQDTLYAQLQATNGCGVDSLRYAIVVQPSNLRIDLAVNGNQLAGCAPYAVQLVNNSQNGHQFTWDFGDGQQLATSRNLDTVAHLFTTPGQYTVRLRGTNACTDTATTETIFVGRKPLATLLPHAPSLCVGDSLLLRASSDSAQAFQWQLPGGALLQGAQVMAKFTNPGQQALRLVATRQYSNGLACGDTAFSTLLVNATAPGKLQLSDTAGNCGPLTVRFSHAHSGIAQTQWLLSNGQQLMGDTGRFVLSQNGLYKVNMRATTAGGCQLADSGWVRLQSPQGQVQYNATLACGDAPVTFNAQFTGADSVRWAFGDGTVLTTAAAQVQHQYQSQGKYLPTATLWKGSTQCALALPAGDSILVEKLQLQLKVQNQQQCGFTTVRFNDSATRQNTGFQHFWRLGNGLTSNAASPVATYTVSNQYPIFYRLSTPNGCADSLVQNIAVQVKAKPQASIGGDSSGCTSARLHLKAVVNSADSIISYQWKGPNGFSSAGTQPIFTAAQPGNYPFVLVVASSALCYDTAQAQLAVRPSPQVKAGADVLLCRGQQTMLQATGAAQYSWSPANFLSNAGVANPMASPVATQRYVVSGTLPGQTCVGTDTLWVKVAQPIKTTVTASDSICAGEVLALQAQGALDYQWSPPAGLSSATVATPLASPAATTRYRVIGRDSAGCFADTAYVTVGVGQPIKVNLGVDRSAATGEKIKLQPTITGGTATQFLWTANGLDCNNCPQPTLTVQGNTQVVLKASSAYGCQASDTLLVKGFCEQTQVYIANAFTPDGDGKNDYLFVQGKGIALVKTLRVFNRWGQVVFEGVNLAPNDVRAGWDGRIKGQPAGTDVYVYTAEVVCDNNVPYTYKGNTTLIR